MPVVDDLLAKLRRVNHALPALVTFGGISLTFLSWLISPHIALLVAVCSLYAAYMEVMTQWAFRAPRVRKPKLVDDHWNPLAYKVSGIEMFTNHASGEKGAQPFGFVTGGRRVPSAWLAGRSLSKQKAGTLSWSTFPVTVAHNA